MKFNVPSTRKRPVNLTINEALVIQAKVYTNNLSATMVSLLADFEVARQSALHNRQRAADACATHWNAVHASIRSFADGHSTL